MQSTTRKFYPIAVLAALLGACATTDQYPAVSTIDLDPSARGPVAGVGIEGQDIVAMTDEMMRDMLASPALAGRSQPPQILIDGSLFTNRSDQRLDKDMIINRLRVALNRSSQGRMVFVGRDTISDVEYENEMKKAGRFDEGTIGRSEKTAGLDFKLRGSIQSAPSRSTKTGMVQRYNLVTFEMQDMARGTLVWSGMYEFARASADDVIYR